MNTTYKLEVLIEGPSAKAQWAVVEEGTDYAAILARFARVTGVSCAPLRITVEYVFEGDGEKCDRTFQPGTDAWEAVVGGYPDGAKRLKRGTSPDDKKA